MVPTNHFLPVAKCQCCLTAFHTLQTVSALHPSRKPAYQEGLGIRPMKCQNIVNISDGPASEVLEV